MYWVSMSLFYAVILPVTGALIVLLVLVTLAQIFVRILGTIIHGHASIAFNAAKASFKMCAVGARRFKEASLEACRSAFHTTKAFIQNFEEATHANT